ncbi:hypothetical protein ACWEOI_09340 [Nocardia sp. NPDC004340]
MKPATFIVGILIAPLLAGCAAKPDKPAAKACQSEIRLDSEPEPLGSSKALTAELTHETMLNAKSGGLRTY